MNWFLHNPVADLYGPYFLVFYTIAIALVVLACYQSIRSCDHTRDIPLPEISAKVDPYQIAYLRGGENEVTRVAVSSLIQRGLLEVNDGRYGLKKVKKLDRGRKPAPGEVSALEARVLKWSGFPAMPAQIFQPRGLASRVSEACAAYQSILDEQHLLAPREMKELGSRLVWLAVPLVLGLGGYKLAVALATGHKNVMFLLILSALGVGAVSIACLHTPRKSRLGKDYLERLKLVYAGVVAKIKPAAQLDPTGELIGQRRVVSQAKPVSASSDCLLALGIFGVAALAGTPFSEVSALFARGASGGCGGGCGGGGSGCGGGGCGGGCGGCGG
jgi:uncharacterized protein (TIGR04222 family)